jgi:hypothetical protein
LGKSANNTFEFATQHFFCDEAKFLARERASAAEDERALSFFNEA